MRFGVVVFPGSNCEMDAFHVLKHVFDQPVEYIWHQERDLSKYDCILLPGGFAYGDYLRTGAIARYSPAMEAVAEHAEQGKLLIGICNGFQILTEAGLLPGALQRNASMQFRCQWTHLRVENNATPFTSTCSPGQVLKIPVNHGEGNYFADPGTLHEMNRNGQILLRYTSPTGELRESDSPNGSIENIAGIVNKRGNVMGMMPHPERACEALLGSEDGRAIFASMIRFLERGVAHV